MHETQSNCFIELAEFNDLARLVCTANTGSGRVYSHMYGADRVISTTLKLASTLLIFYVPMEPAGRYVSYRVSPRTESCIMTNSRQAYTPSYVEIINFDTVMSPLETRTEDFADRIHPLKMSDVASLARLTIKPPSREFSSYHDNALFAFVHKNSWIAGHINSLDMRDPVYQFNYIELESEPQKPFLKYPEKDVDNPKFVSYFRDSVLYMPIIKLKKEHPIFGMSRHDGQNADGQDDDQDDDQDYDKYED